MGAHDLGPVINSLEFDTTEASAPWPIHLDGEYYACTYKRSATSLWIRTFRITALGVISQIDTWEITTVTLTEPRIFHINGTLYALTYSCTTGGNVRGIIETLTISDLGIITESIHDTYIAYYVPDGGFLVNIRGAGGNLFALFSAYPQFLDTVNINIVSGVITGIGFENVAGYSFSVTAGGRITNNMLFSIVNAANNYTVITWEVDDVGAIVTAGVAEQPFSIDRNTEFVNAIKISQNIVAIALRNDTTDVIHIQTVQINNDGSIEDTVIDDYEGSTVLASCIGFCETGIAGSYFIVWQGVDSDGFIDVIDINSAGAISHNASYTAFEFETTFALDPKPLPFSGVSVPIFYTGPDNDGFLSAVTFSYLTEGPHHEMLMKIGP